MNAFFELSRDQDNLFACLDRTNNWCDPHFHSNIEVVYVLKGSMEITINGQTRVLHRRDLAVSNSYEIHTYNTPVSSHCKILLIPTDMVNSFILQSQGKTFATPFLPAGDHDRRLREVIYNLAEFDESDTSLMLKGYLYVLLGLLSEKLGLTDQNYRSGASDLIRKILIYLEQHYTESLTIEGIAHYYGYSKGYLSRLFNANLNCSFNHYLNLLRARHAARLIRNTAYSMDEIAYQSGFQSVRTFHRAFQKYYDTTPLDYKKKKVVDRSFDDELEYLASRWPELASTLNANHEKE